MKLRINYFIYIGLLHTLLMVFVIIYFLDKPLLLLLAEIGIIISLVFAWHIYQKLVLPIHLMASGVGSLKEKDFSMEFKPTGYRELDELIGLYNQMIEQLRLERTYSREQHFLLEKLIQASPAGILLMDFDGYIHTMNTSAERILGKAEAELKGLTLLNLPIPFAEEINALSVNEANIIQLEGTRFYRATRSQFIDRGFERQFILLEELSQEILRAEKRAYDKVIRMMSHEVNNSIGAVNSILQSLMHINDLETDFREAIGVAESRNLRLSKFMSNFADVVKLSPPKLRVVPMMEMLRDLILLMKRQAQKQGVQLCLEASEQEVMIDCDKEQMEQALLNIIKNSIESATPGGVVKLQLASNSITIVDNGKGITAEVGKKLFTPFYSTKPQGQGIGLMLVREILRNHKFTFSLQSLADGWTYFRIDWQ